MYVIKRNQNKEPVKFDKISWRIENLVIEFNLTDVDPVIITQKLSQRIFSGITTTELDNLASQICMDMISIHPNYGKLGGYIAISNHQKNTYSDIWWNAPLLKGNSYKQITNNLKYQRNPDNGTCIDPTFCNVLYKKLNHTDNLIKILKPAPIPTQDEKRVNYFTTHVI